MIIISELYLAISGSRRGGGRRSANNMDFTVFCLIFKGGDS